MNTDTGEVVVAAAGMEPPLLVRADGLAEPVEVRGAILGVESEATYGAQTVVLEGDDMFLLVTDGITEARGAAPRRALFGYERFTRAAQTAKATFGDSNHVAQQIVVAAREFAQGKLQDDVCVLVAKRSLSTEIHAAVAEGAPASDEAATQPLSGIADETSEPHLDLAQFALEVTGIGYWELSTSTGVATRSRRHDQIFGYETPPLTWTYEQFLSHVYPPDRAEVDALYGRALAQQTDWQFQCRIIRAGDGAERWIEAHGRHFGDPQHGNAPTRIIGTVADITARKTTESKLEASRQEIRDIWARVTDACIALDAEWRVTFANPAAEALLGSTAKTMRHRSFWSVFEPARGTVVEQECLRAMREQVPVQFASYYERWGTWFEARLFPSPNGISIYFRDITAQKEAAAQYRTFLKEMLFGLTEGKVRLCDSADSLPALLPLVSHYENLTAPEARTVRKAARAETEQLGVTQERLDDFETAIGEATMNAIRHAKEAQCSIHADREQGIVQVWVRDTGEGIAEHLIHRAMERGWTTGGFGQGMFLMHRLSDCFYLLTRPTGTTVVLELHRVPPPPSWLADFPRDKEGPHLSNLLGNLLENQDDVSLIL